MGPADDVPSQCNRCHAFTLHRRGTDGQLHCVDCMVRASVNITTNQARTAAVVHVRAPKPGVMGQTIKLAGFIVSVIFLVSLGTCVYVCGSAVNASKKPAEPAVAPTPPPRAVVTAPSDDPRREAMASINRMIQTMGGDAIALSSGDMFIMEPGIRDKCAKRDLAKIVAALRETLLDAGFVRARCTDWADDKSIPIAASKPKPSKPKPAPATPGGLVDPFGGQ